MKKYNVNNIIETINNEVVDVDFYNYSKENLKLIDTYDSLCDIQGAINQLKDDIVTLKDIKQVIKRFYPQNTDKYFCLIVSLLG